MAERPVVSEGGSNWFGCWVLRGCRSYWLDGTGRVKSPLFILNVGGAVMFGWMIEQKSYRVFEVVSNIVY